MRTAEPIEHSTEPLQEPVASRDTAISCLVRLAAQNRGVEQIEAARRSIEPVTETLPLSKVVELAAGFGLQAERVRLDWQGLKRAVSANPVIVVRDSGGAVVVTGGGRPGTEEVSVWDPDHDGVVFFVSREDFERSWSGHALLITPEEVSAKPFGISPQPRKPPRRTRYWLGLSLGIAVAALVVSGGMVLFLLTAPNADQGAGPGSPGRAASTRAQDIAKPDGTAPLGAATPEASAAVQPHL